MKKSSPMRVTVGCSCLLLVGGLLFCAVRADEPADPEPKPPLGLPPVYFPDDNLWSTAKAELGRLLYFDKRLSSDGTVYTLMDEEHDQRRDSLTEFRKAAIEHMAHIVRVNGTLSEVSGQKAIFVQGYLKK